MDSQLKKSLETLLSNDVIDHGSLPNKAIIPIDDLLVVSELVYGADSIHTEKLVLARQKGIQELERRRKEAESWDDWRDSLVKK